MKFPLIVLVSALSCANAFAPSSKSTKKYTLNQQQQQQQQQRPFLCSTAASDADTAVSSAILIDGSNDNDWWKNYVFQHDSVAKETRSDFPILKESVGADADGQNNLKPLVYLDSAATSQKPDFVINEISKYYTSVNSNVHRGAHFLSRKATTKYEAARDTIATFVNANSRNEIVFTSGATQALNLIASSYGRSNIQKGGKDEIITTVLEHHSNFVPWQILADETGATVKYIALDPATGAMDLKQLEQTLSENTKIVTFQHVSNVLGCIHPVKDIVQMVRSKAPHAKIVLDACQSVPHMKVDVQELGVDFLAASGHKACGPTGIGFLWGREELLNAMPPYMGGGEMIDVVSVDGSTFAKAPARFEAGTPAIAQAIGLGAAIEYLNTIGMDRIEQYEHEAANYLYKRLSAVKGVTVLGPKAPPPKVDTTTTTTTMTNHNRAALCSFVCDSVHPSDLSTFLDMEGVAVRAGHHCCQPLHTELGHSHSARASLYFYNTKEDIDFFIEKLESTLTFFENMEDGLQQDEDGETEFVPFI